MIHSSTTQIQEVSRPLGRAAGDPGTIGDVLVVFGQDARSAPTRTEGGCWEVAQAERNWQMWTAASNSNWRGFPWKAFQVEEWNAWLIGEMYGLSRNETVQDAVGAVLLGRRSAESLNGHFLLWAWNTRQRQWHVWTNRFGTLHGYYAHNGEQAAFGTFFPAVSHAASRRSLDWTALTAYFGLGFQPHDRTFFDDVRILRPASHYTFDSGGCLTTNSRYWQWWHQPKPRRSHSSLVDEFHALIGPVVAEHAGSGRVAVPISGGLDSRTIVAALPQRVPSETSQESPWSFSYGYENNSIETMIAARIARARSLPFERFTITPYLFGRMEEILRCLEGFQDATLSRQAAVTDAISRRADRVIAGHWGDVWCDTLGLAEERSPSKERIVSHALAKLSKPCGWLLEHLCRPQLPDRDSDAILRDVAVQELQAVEHIEDPDFRLKAFKTDQWSFRWTTPSLRMYQAAAFPRLPFYDTRIVDFFCTVPSPALIKRKLQVEYLKRFAPDLARITWQGYRTNLYHYQHFHSWLLPKRVAVKFWQTVVRRQKRVRRNWEVQFLGPAGRQELRTRLLRPGHKLHEFVAPRDVELLLESLFAANGDQRQNAYAVSMLLTFSSWLDLFG